MQSDLITPPAGYSCILADPPWNERGAGKYKRGADSKYPLLKTKDIAPTICAADKWNPAVNSHLWLWATNNHLPDALQVMKDLGFVYKTNVVWVKLRKGTKVHVDVRKAMTAGAPLGEVMRIALNKGMGRYLRGGHELLLFGTRGRGWAVRTEHNMIPSVIFAPVGEHSQKPEAARALIEDRSQGPRLEMFARSSRPGWDRWDPMPGHKFLVFQGDVQRGGTQTLDEAVALCVDETWTIQEVK